MHVTNEFISMLAEVNREQGTKIKSESVFHFDGLAMYKSLRLVSASPNHGTCGTCVLCRDI